MENVAISPDSLSDPEIIEKIKKGDASLFGLLMDKYDPVLYKITRRYGFQKEDAADVLQDTRVCVYCKLKQFKFRSSFKTWLSKIVINKCLYKLKYGHRRYEECSSVMNEKIEATRNGQFENAEIIFLKKELHTLLQKSLSKIPVIYKTIFILREVEGYSVAETATLLNISGINVRVRLSRAKMMLQEKLKKSYSNKEC